MTKFDDPQAVLTGIGNALIKLGELGPSNISEDMARTMRQLGVLIGQEAEFQRRVLAGVDMKAAREFTTDMAENAIAEGRM